MPVLIHDGGIQTIRICKETEQFAQFLLPEDILCDQTSPGIFSVSGFLRSGTVLKDDLTEHILDHVVIAVVINVLRSDIHIPDHTVISHQAYPAGKICFCLCCHADCIDKAVTILRMNIVLRKTKTTPQTGKVHAKLLDIIGDIIQLCPRNRRILRVFHYDHAAPHRFQSPCQIIQGSVHVQFPLCIICFGRRNFSPCVPCPHKPEPNYALVVSSASWLLPFRSPNALSVRAFVSLIAPATFSTDSCSWDTNSPILSHSRFTWERVV